MVVLDVVTFGMCFVYQDWGIGGASDVPCQVASRARGAICTGSGA